jgi:DUF4097 and DUF4098 domain-containing protein YvlB
MKIKKILLLLPFFLLIFFSSNLPGCSFHYADADDDNLRVLHERTFKISPGNLFKLETVAGNVLITTWDRSEVYIKVLGNDNAEEKVEFNFSGNEEEVIVSAKREGLIFSLFSSGVRMRFEVKVPKQFNTTAHTSGGDIRAADINGKNNLRTSGGDIFLKRLSGELKAGTSGGDITIENTSGEIHLSTSGGNIDASDFTGNFEASTSGGDIKLKGNNSKIDARTSGGDISLIYSGQNNGIQLSTSGGDIDVDVPSDFNANAKLSTSGGSVSCNLTINNATKISSSKFEADLNSGGKPFIVKTSGGDITVRKK